MQLKILGKEFKRIDDKDFELYLVDEIKNDDEFVQILDKNLFGLVQKLSKFIYTDGQIKVISQRDRLYHKCAEVRYKFESANWYLKKDQDNIQLYVKADYESDIKTGNKDIDNFIAKHYMVLKNIIQSKKQFARDMSKLAYALNLPFELVMCFRGDEESISQFVDTVRKAIAHCFYADSLTMKKLISYSSEERQEIFDYIGLYVPKTYMEKALKIGKYAYNCLEKREIIGYT